MTYYMRSAFDMPHLRHAAALNRTRCGLALGGMTPVSEPQVLVFLGDRRCAACDPSHKFRALKESR